MRLKSSISRGFTVLRRNWLLVVGSAIAAALLLYRLPSLPSPGLLSRPELALAQDGGNWRHLLNEPFYLPYRAVAWLARQLLFSHPVWALRLPSVLLSLLALLTTIYVVRRWYGPRTAFFGFVLLSTSAAWLHPGRLATVDIVYFAAIPLLLMAHIRLAEIPGRRSLFSWLAINTCLLYVPGLVWLVLLQILWQRTSVNEAYRQLQRLWERLLVSALPAIGLAPLLYGFFKHLNFSYVLTWIGAPANLPGVSELVKHLGIAVVSVFFHSPNDPSRWLSTLPLFSLFLIVCFIAGVLFYVMHARAERSRLLGMMLLLVLLLLAAGAASRSLLVPLLYVIAFGGIAYLLRTWLVMFPRNIAAKWLGIVIVSVAVSLNVAYDLRQYFIAWPHNTETRAAFHYRPPQR